jgi:hypothetical protein
VTFPGAERRPDLRFLVHLVEDLHIGDNHGRGANATRFQCFNRGSNRHRVGDFGIIDHVGRGEDGGLADPIAMDSPEARKGAMRGSVEDRAGDTC